MSNWVKNLQKEVLESVKMIEIEERYDLVFSRPAGLFFAKIAMRLNMTPTQVSIGSLLIGSFGGALFLFQDNYSLVLLGCFCLVMAGILDSSDGQLARMTNQGTDIGRIIDGIVDNAVFITAYVCAAVYLFDHIGVLHSYIIAALGGAAHSWKSAVYEFHKSEYLYYVGNFRSSKLPTPEEVEANFKRETMFERFVFVLYLDYCKKQQNTGFRKQVVRKEFEKLAFSDATRDKFVKLYEVSNQRMLYWWAWIGGTNVQRAGIIISLLFGRFDVFLYINALSMIPFYFVGQLQRKRDYALLASFEENNESVSDTEKESSDSMNA
jgi:phosphatidylglycerophosphate synthase